MLTQEDDVEIHALAARGWSVSAIARHTGRDRKTVRKYLAGAGAGRGASRRRVAWSRSATTSTARFVDDPHVEATVLHRELVDAGFDRSYPTLVRELRRLELRPLCKVCQHRRGAAVTVEIAHPPGEEIQWDWLELHETPWGEPAFVLVGALSHSGRFRGVFCEQMTFGHLAEAMHRVLVALGGTPRVWRTDRMATIVNPGTDRLTVDAAQAAKHYGVEIAVCPPRRAQRKGVVEAAIQYLTSSWWRSAPVTTMAEAQRSLDRWCGRGRRPAPARRGGTVGELGAAEPLLPLPAVAYPALIAVERMASRSALVAFEGNRYSVPPGLAGAHRDRPRPRRRAASCGSSPPRASWSRRIAAPRRAPGRRSAAPSTPPRSSRRCWPRSRPTTPAGARPTGRPARTRSPSSRGSGPHRRARAGDRPRALRRAREVAC